MVADNKINHEIIVDVRQIWGNLQNFVLYGI